MTQTNWEGGDIRSQDEKRNIVSTFKDQIPVFNRSKWQNIRLWGLILIAVIWYILPLSNHPILTRPSNPRYQPQAEFIAANPFVAKSHAEEGLEERKELAKDVEGKDRDPLVVDQADLFSAKDEKRLLQKAEDLSAQYKMNLVIVTASSTRLSEDERDKSDSIWARDYADDFFDYHQYGEDGVLFLISLSPRQVWISTTGTGIKLLTDKRIEHMLDEIFKYADLSNGDYAMSPYIFLDQMEVNLKSGWSEEGVSPNDKLLKKRYVTAVELKRALLLAAAICLWFYISNRLRYASKPIPDIYDVKKRAALSQLAVNDNFLTRESSTRKISTGSGGGGGGGGSSGGGGGSSSHSGSSGGSHGGGGRGF